jgi:adenosine/AMP kinase
MVMKFMTFWPTLMVVASIGYLAVGAAILDKAMSFIHRHKLSDAEFRRLAQDDSYRVAAMRVAQLAILAGWPVAVTLAIIANQRRQSGSFAAT